MIFENQSNILEPKAYELWMEGDYERSAQLYEQVIVEEPSQISSYWHLGLMRLLQGKKVTAKITWDAVRSKLEREENRADTGDLIDILQTEAIRQASLENYTNVYSILDCVIELFPDQLDEVLNHTIFSSNFPQNDYALLHPMLIKLLDYKKNQGSSNFLTFLEKFLDFFPHSTHTIDWLEKLTFENIDILSFKKLLLTKLDRFIKNQVVSTDIIIKYAELSLKLEPHNLSVLINLAEAYQRIGLFKQSIEVCNQVSIKSSTSLEHQISASYLTMKSLLNQGGAWQNSYETSLDYQRLMRDLMDKDPPLPLDFLLGLMGTLSFPPYFTDTPQNTHEFRSQFAQFYQTKVQAALAEGVKQDRYKSSYLGSRGNSLRIGYLSSCFCRHSVGWIARWLFAYHNPEKFQIYAYSLRYQNDDLQSYIAERVFKFHDVSRLSPIEIAKSISDDKIDILVDLDSLTHHLIAPVLALKPAPIQVTWLGSDASDLPAVDYFLADPYVLPESAQNYYVAKIWRIPQVYLAVDGFEVGIPTLRRDQLGIPDDAVVYFSGQTGYKRNPNNVKLQLQIIKQVPKSYFLVKSSGDQESVKGFFKQMANELGLEDDRLRFLPEVASEEIHRANLSIADIVLDTYPYNGATTTLETLWMRIPLVTRVGEQFASRNSYTMMMNVGVNEGIAWTDEEYVNWGIRLGKDAPLRKEISWRMLHSRQISSLWNAEEFTRNMERTYQKMWSNYMNLISN
ncbi:O-linked N-acetylglucosamine transferase, SPINDLY family protein [Oscillatoria sp. HE19RPO]|uniref:O-linked N-acetylglucosamine transferase, SPINDLY family protein n=1 Tax=Oscillatoria sp. HE19RPO TaxID=2954806 RepID=UPI0020C427F7|nr:O-linked N-acetylglucosamine transferase, SPINDLY family protein [Oscillatoria sp. HE19RPO]